MKGIIRRGGKYVARPKIDGRQVWLGTFNTEEEAEDAIIEARNRKRIASGKELSVSELISLYRSQRGPHLSAATKGNYWRALSSYEASFGTRRASVPPEGIEIQEWANGVPEQYLKAVRTLYQWAKLAVREIDSDPTENIRPRPPTRKHRVHILSVDEVHALADAALEIHDETEATYLRAQILFAAGTGMRPGEIAALRFGDLDCANQEVRVERSREYTGAEKAPKNGRARTIALTPIAAEALDSLPAGLPEQRVFELPDGQLLVRANLSRYFDPVRRHAGFPGYRFYDLRHTCATFLLEMGMPSYIVAIQLGHSDGGRLVESTYGHPSVQAALDRIKRETWVAVTGQMPALRVASGGALGGDAA